MNTRRKSAATVTDPTPRPATPCACRLDSFNVGDREVTLCSDHAGLSELLVAIHGAGLEGHSLGVSEAPLIA